MNELAKGLGIMTILLASLAGITILLESVGYLK